jgi:hypothetical protein
MSAEGPADAIEEALPRRGRRPGFAHDEDGVHARDYSASPQDGQDGSDARQRGVKPFTDTY